MINSIKDFLDNGIGNLEEVENSFLKNPAELCQYVIDIHKQTDQLGRNLIKNTIEEMDEAIRNSGKRLCNWYIVRKDSRQLTTSLGDIEFERTLFKNKKTGERRYLLDSLLDLEKHRRITEDAEALIYAEAEQTSYSKAGSETLPATSVTKQTVKRELHALEFPEIKTSSNEKKKVDFLYIDADEDHIHLQFRNVLRDIEKNEKGYKNNGAMEKIVYVYEGVEKKGKRRKLINVRYFCGEYKGELNSALWDEVYDYIESTYDIDSIKKIYLNADGGAWIKSGANRIAGITTALDEFHLQKYLNKATNHLLDSAEDARKELRECIESNDKEAFKNSIQKAMNVTDSEAVKNRVRNTEEYILSNWEAAYTRVSYPHGIIGSSTEGHVYHVLSERMSTKALGWCCLGADKMAHLRAYSLNGGDMLELARYQKKVRKKARLLKAAGAEEKSDDYNVLSSSEVINSLNKNRARLKDYGSGVLQGHLSLQNRKQYYFSKLIWLF